MQLVVDENDKIVNFALIGSIENSIEVELDSDTENHLISNFEPEKFLYKNGEIVEDDNYIPPVPETITQVSDTQQALGAVSKQVAELTKQNQQLQQALGVLTLQLAKEDK